MKKHIALMLAALILAGLLSGCNLVQLDAEKDGAMVVAKIGDEVITKQEAAPEHEQLVAYYKSYGITDKESLDSLKESYLQSLAEERVVHNKIVELKLDEFSAEDEARIREEVQADYDSMLESYTAMMGSEDSTEEEIREEARKYLADNGYTVEAALEQAMHTEEHTRLEEHVTKDMTVTDEQVQAHYQTLLEEAKTEYQELSAYEYARREDGAVIVYNPPGFRRVRNLLLSFDEEHASKIDELQAQIAELEDGEDEEFASGTVDSVMYLGTQDTAVDGFATQDTAQAIAQDATSETEGEPEPEATLNPEDEKKIAELKTQLEQARNDAKATLEPKLAEITAKIAEGVSFAELLAAYGEDPGMKEEPGLSEGYYVSAESAGWVPEFKDAAMALQNVGDVGQPFVSDYGVHILEYVADVPEGEVPLSEVREQVAEQALENVKLEAFDEQMNKWIEEAKIEIFPDRL